jgi:CubicO group peptidase (beta-lactamase class C family)
MRLGLSRSFWLMLAAIVVMTAVAIAAPRIHRMALLGSGYMAQTLCAGLFIAGRDFDSLMAQDLSGPGRDALALFTPTVERDAKAVSAATFGIAHQTAIHRDGLGCTLIDGVPADVLRAEAAGLFPPAPPPDRDAEWPDGARVTTGAWPQGVDGAAAERAIEAIFSDPDPAHPRGTRALVVVHGGRIVAERYADGFDAETPVIGWSMSKTAINALVGLRVKDGAITLDDTDLMPQWREDGDPRGAITLNQLMRMTSGLAFSENYNNKLSDISQMLFVEGNGAAFAASKPLIHAPGTHWSYSGGTTEIIAAILRETFADERAYWRFPRERLFAPLGMRTAELAPDASGTFMGASSLYASARDWARLGLLFLQDGVWGGERLLPAGWVANSVEPTPQSPNDEYGAQVWLKLPLSPGLGEPPMPEDGFYMLGYDGQVVAVVPSRDLVIVRLGLTQRGGNWEPARDLSPLVYAFPQRSAQ